MASMETFSFYHWMLTDSVIVDLHISTGVRGTQPSLLFGASVSSMKLFRACAMVTSARWFVFLSEQTSFIAGSLNLTCGAGNYGKIWSA
jgi:hypothetical protein